MKRKKAERDSTSPTAVSLTLALTRRAGTTADDGPSSSSFVVILARREREGERKKERETNRESAKETKTKLQSGKHLAHSGRREQLAQQ